MATGRSKEYEDRPPSQIATSNSRWRRFSLRALLAATTVACGVLGLWSIYIAPYRSRWMVASAVAELNGSCRTEVADGSNLERWLVTTILGSDKYVHINAIDLDNTAASDDTLALISSITELEELRLDRTRISDTGVARLTNLPRLTSLSLRYCGISDEGLGILDTLPRDLRLLALTGTGITDASKAHFVGRSITDLYLRWTAVTGQGARDILEVLDRGTVHHEDGALRKVVVAR